MNRTWTTVPSSDISSSFVYQCQQRLNASQDAILKRITACSLCVIQLFFISVICFIGSAAAADSGVSASDNSNHQPPQSLELRNILFSHMTTRDGLSQASITSITQDSQGFIWFGTQEGLNRYDGKKVEVFDHDYKDPTSLSHDWVWSLSPGKDGSMWVGTDGGGLSHFDPETKQFRHFRNEPDNSNSLSGDRVRVVYQDSQGILWIGTDGEGLNRFDITSGTFTRYQHLLDDPHSLSDDTVLSILEDRRGNLWVGTRNGGLNRLDRNNGKFNHYRQDPNDENSLSHDRVRALFEDRDGNLWVGTYESGLNLFQPETEHFVHFQHDPDDVTSLSNNHVMDIYQDRNGTVWVATDGGLNEWRQDASGFARYRYDLADPDSLSNDRATAIFQDQGGVLWIGTYNGVSKWNYVSESFTYYQESGTKHKLSSNIITAAAESQGGELWVGTYGGGLNKLDLLSGETVVYRNSDAEQSSLSDDRIMTMFVDQQQIVWVGTLGGGLNRLDPDTGLFSHFRHDPQNPHSLSHNGVTSIYGDTNGELWIGTYGGGVNHYDPVTQQFTVYKHDPGDNSSVSSNRVMAVYRDRTGILWLGTEDGGLNRFDAETGTFSRYQHDPNSPHSLGNNGAWAIHESRDGSLWIGTNGGGLNRWSLKDRQANRAIFKQYRKSDGLRSDNIMAILEDNWGKIWLSSNRGLARLDPETDEVRTYNLSNGLKDNNFNFAARLASRKGELLFGSLSGLVSFMPDQMGTNEHLPPVALSASTRNGVVQTTHSDEIQPREIKLSYADELIVFEFAGLDFSEPEKNLYRYKLDGFDSEWSEPAQYPRTTYTSLPTGHYTFRVMAANNDGVWNQQQAKFVFEIVPPPWLSIWAYMIYLVIIMSLIAVYVRTQSNKLLRETRQRQELEQQVTLRTLELAERNGELQQLNVTLKDISATDALTGLKNRRYLQDYMKSEVGRIHRQTHDLNPVAGVTDAMDISPAMSFVMIDLDGFKGVNDTYGHDAGDQVLLQVRDILQQCCRSSDIITRWGGDEFLILCRHSKPHAVERLCERIRKSLAEHQFHFGGGNTCSLSGSIGFAKYPFSQSKPELVDWEQVTIIADRAAYLSKQNGRNAWAGIYSGRNITQQECMQIKHQLSVLLARERVSVKTSIEGELVFNEVPDRQSL